MENPTPPPAPSLLVVAIYGAIGIITIAALLAYIISNIVSTLAFFPTYIVLLLAGAVLLALRMRSMIASREQAHRDRERIE